MDAGAGYCSWVLDHEYVGVVRGGVLYLWGGGFDWID